MSQFTISSKIRDYKVYFEKTPEFLKKLVLRENSIFIVDQNVWNLYENGLLRIIKKAEHILLPISEGKKTLSSVTKLYDQVLEKSPKKNLTVISIGGGITQDISGFFTSTLYRGVNWIYIPTTLLAQGDSCIGAKTSLNFKKYKNLIGTFYPPNEIYIYPHFLDTLSEIDYFSGLGEIVKLFFIGGKKYIKDLLGLLPKLIKRDDRTTLKAINKALTLKKDYIEGDEFDQGRRNILNYGHCFGHALERATDYAICHGQAVIAGMIFANIVARNRGILSENKEAYLKDNYLLRVLKTDFKNISLDKNKIIEGMKKDKKRLAAGLVLIMMDTESRMLKINDLYVKEAIEAMGELQKIFSTWRVKAK